jgi:hypothetical protein
MKKLKLAVLTLGLGLSMGANAWGTSQLCQTWCMNCNNGSQIECELWYANKCGFYGNSCTPRS